MYNSISILVLVYMFLVTAVEKEMATHSSVLAWRIPGTAEPGGLPSMRSHRVGHDWSDLAAAIIIYWNDWPFSIELPLYLCAKANWPYICGSFLKSPFCCIDLSLYQYHIALITIALLLVLKSNFILSLNKNFRINLNFTIFVNFWV